MTQKLTGIVALVAALVALAFQLVPDLTPDPRIQEAASVKVTTVDRNVLNADAARSGGARACPTSSALRGGVQLGAVVYTRLHVQGLKHGIVTVRCGVFNAAQNVAITSPALGPSVSLTAQVTTNDEAVAPLFVELPTYPGELKVRVAAFDERGTMLAYADSKPFPSGVLASPEVRRATRAEERAITHAIRAVTSRSERPHFYLSAVGVLKRGSAFNRGRWAVVNVTPFPRFRDEGTRRVALLHVTKAGWHDVPRSRGCMVPEEILIALNLPAPRC